MGWRAVVAADAVRPAEAALSALEADIDRSINTGWETVRSGEVAGVAHDHMMSRRVPDRTLAVRR